MRNRDPRWVVPLASLLFTANPSPATTIHVPADAPTIQAGIDAAAAGDSVIVAPGTYTGSGNKNLDFNGKDIVLTSESGAASSVIDSTIIDCQNNGRAFFQNSGETLGYILGGGLTVGGTFATIENCIFASGTSGPAIMGTACSATCTDIIDNAGGDWVDCVEGQKGVNGNISADPLFCNLAQDDLRLDESSPCAPGNSGGCGLIGAHGVGCGTTAVSPTTWGRLKSMWRK